MQTGSSHDTGGLHSPFGAYKSVYEVFVTNAFKDVFPYMCFHAYIDELRYSYCTDGLSSCTCLQETYATFQKLDQTACIQLQTLRWLHP